MCFGPSPDEGPEDDEQPGIAQRSALRLSSTTSVKVASFSKRSISGNTGEFASSVDVDKCAAMRQVAAATTCAHISTKDTLKLHYSSTEAYHRVKGSSSFIFTSWPNKGSQLNNNTHGMFWTHTGMFWTHMGMFWTLMGCFGCICSKSLFRENRCFR